jgi:DNA polymerase I-like protein with 3'-5' exonuclease and polymerase domains
MVGYSERQWQQVMDEYYIKYKGIKKWHDNLLLEAMKHGFIEIPSGRYFTFRPGVNGRWPLTTIKNYPVQGLGTVHDSLKFDTPEKNVYNVSKILKDAVEAVPQMCMDEWGYNFELPLTCEIKVGPNQKDLTELQF